VVCELAEPPHTYSSFALGENSVAQSTSIEPGDFIVGYNKLRSTGKLYSVESRSNWEAFASSYTAEDGVRLRIKRMASLRQILDSSEQGARNLDADLNPMDEEDVEDYFPLANLPIADVERKYGEQNPTTADPLQPLVTVRLVFNVVYVHVSQRILYTGHMGEQEFARA
jgi:hypothetical protein